MSIKDLLDFSLFRKKRQDVADHLDSLERQMAQLRAERTSIVQCSPDKDDVKSAVRAAVDRLASGFDAEVAKGIAMLAREHDRLAQPAFVDAVLTGSVPGLQTKLGEGATPPAALLAALMGDAIVNRLHQVIDASPWPDNAFSGHVRHLRLAAIDTELAQLKKTYDEVQAAAESAGLSL